MVESRTSFKKKMILKKLEDRSQNGRRYFYTYNQQRSPSKYIKYPNKLLRRQARKNWQNI